MPKVVSLTEAALMISARHLHHLFMLVSRDIPLTMRFATAMEARPLPNAIQLSRSATILEMVRLFPRTQVHIYRASFSPPN